MLEDYGLTVKGILLATLSCILFLLVFVSICYGIGAVHAQYRVWQQAKVGQAELSRADWNRQITVKEAQAKKDAATELAAAEIERAKGVAKANKIIGDSLKGNEDYLRYLWIDSIQNTKDKIIYVPTEANLPILEASRLKK